MSSVSALDSLLSSSTSSSSSIDLSSILQAATGSSSSGIDVTSAVNSAITAARQPETDWENQETTLQSQITALDTLQTDATNLDDDMQSLNSLTGPLSDRTVSSSDSSVVTGSAASGSTPGTHVVVVNSLATTASWTSGVYASSSTALPSGSFTITTGSGSTATITTDGTQTLSDVVSTINNDSLGVTASVVTDATGSRLAVVSNSSGSAANFTISTWNTGFGFTQAATGANASLTVDGIGISSASNTVTGVVSGLTLNLSSAAPNSSVTLEVAPDTSQSESAINQFVTDYNQLITDLTTQFTFSGTSEGPLASDPTVRSLQNEVLGVLSYTYSPTSGSTTVSNLTSLGISVGDDGKLTVDSGTLESALQSNFSDVQNFFQGTALNGFANSFDQQLTSFISPSDGAFTVDLQSINSEITDLQNNVTNYETNYITPLKTQLTNDYSEAETLLQELPSEKAEINEELGLNTSSSS